MHNGPISAPSRPANMHYGYQQLGKYSTKTRKTHQFFSPDGFAKEITLRPKAAITSLQEKLEAEVLDIVMAVGSGYHGHSC